MNKALLAVLMILILGACSVGYYIPISSDKVTTEDRYAIIRTDSLLIAVRPYYYPDTGNSYSSRFFSIYLQVRNNSSQNRVLSPGSFSILADGRQFDYIPLQLILSSTQSSLFLDQGNWFAEPSLFPDTTDPYEKDREHALELINNYFSFGDLIPGGRKEGFLFYNRDLQNKRQITIDVFGTPVSFGYSK